MCREQREEKKNIGNRKLYITATILLVAVNDVALMSVQIH